jgi:hypothetical protein
MTHDFSDCDVETKGYLVSVRDCHDTRSHHWIEVETQEEALAEMSLTPDDSRLVNIQPWSDEQEWDMMEKAGYVL